MVIKAIYILCPLKLTRLSNSYESFWGFFLVVERILQMAPLYFIPPKQL